MGDPTLQELERHQAVEEKQLQEEFGLVPPKRFRSEPGSRKRLLRLLLVIAFAATIIGLLIF